MTQAMCGTELPEAPESPQPAPPPEGDLFRSPSGLLTRAVWEHDLKRGGGPMPDWYASDEERERQFARWVQIEAKTLAGQLEGLVRPGTRRGLTRHLRAVAAALADDAEWARRRIDGR